ncbi:MAG TPA: hypothetical protein VGG70_05505 [Candidatus Cybelea sp.]
MILLAHILMFPVEEVLVPLAGGVGAGTALWLAAFLSPLRTKLRH